MHHLLRCKAQAALMPVSADRIDRRLRNAVDDPGDRGFQQCEWTPIRPLRRSELPRRFKIPVDVGDQMDLLYMVSLKDGPSPAVLTFDHSNGLQSQDDLYQAMKATRGAVVYQLLKLGCVRARWIITERWKCLHQSFSHGAAYMLTPGVEQCCVLLPPNCKPLIQWNHGPLLLGCESPHARNNHISTRVICSSIARGMYLHIS